MVDYINSLNDGYPTGQTLGSLLDDDLQDLKDAILNTFPNLDGAVTATDTELNYLSGVSSAIQTQLTNLSSQISTLENRVVLYNGESDNNGTAVSLPSGWAVARIAQGQFRITHNLGKAVTKYSPMGQPIVGNSIKGSIATVSTNTFDIWFHNFNVSPPSVTDPTSWWFMLAVSA